MTFSIAFYQYNLSTGQAKRSVADMQLIISWLLL